MNREPAVATWVDDLYLERNLGRLQARLGGHQRSSHSTFYLLCTDCQAIRKGIHRLSSSLLFCDTKHFFCRLSQLLIGYAVLFQTRHHAGVNGGGIASLAALAFCMELKALCQKHHRIGRVVAGFYQLFKIPAGMNRSNDSRPAAEMKVLSVCSCIRQTDVHARRPHSPALAGPYRPDAGRIFLQHFFVDKENLLFPAVCTIRSARGILACFHKRLYPVLQQILYAFLTSPTTYLVGFSLDSA